jgi:hypothetical protein
MPHFSITYREGQGPHARNGTQLIAAENDAEAARIAKEVCRPGSHNRTPRVIVKIEAVN